MPLEKRCKMGCNFPLMCYRNKFTCCHECDLECEFGCPLDKEKCEDYTKDMKYKG